MGRFITLLHLQKSSWQWLSLISSTDNKCCVSEEISQMEMPNSFRSANKQLLASDDWRAMKFDGSIDRLSSIPGFGSESLSEIVDSFRLPENAQMGNYSCAQGLPSSMEHTADHYFRGKKRNKLDKCTGSPVNYDHTINQNYEAEKPKDGSTQNTKSSMERIYEKKQKNEVDSSSQGNSNAPNKDYIHIRAKRGQATNSHSLAERVRREKISERMKLLQDIVPGCNKITGKAVMLDEIINYVQSLQKQVEFLSMKLATVTPEINIGMEKKFAKEVRNMHSRYENSTYNGHLQEMVIPDVRLQSRMEILSAYNNMDFLRTANNYQLPDLSQVPNAWDNHSSGLQF